MEQTTGDSEPKAVIISSSREQELVDLWRENACLHKRIEFLEMRLEQREQETRKDYQSMKPYFDALKSKILQIFLDLPISMGLSHPEISEEFRQRFPVIKTVDLPRRTRELCKEQKLWSCPDQDGTVRFYLKLLPDIDDRKNQHDSMANLKSPEEK